MQRQTQTPQVTQRVVKVSLVHVADDTWKQLRRLAYHCAQFGNNLLSEQYAKKKGLQAEWKTYRDYRDTLSSYVRDAMQREVQAMWQRNGRDMLRGAQTVGRFAADRALVIRERGIVLTRHEDGQLAFMLRFEPSPAPAIELPVFMPSLKKDPLRRQLLDAFLTEPERMRKASVIFHRPGRKISLFVAYTKALPADPGQREGIATVHCLGDGECWIWAHGNRLTLTDRIYRMVHMKEHFGRIHARLRFALGRKGRWHVMKKKLAAVSNFESWVQGPLHQLSHEIVAWADQQRVAEIKWQIDDTAPELPWYALQQMVQYKAAERGIVAANRQVW